MYKLSKTGEERIKGVLPILQEIIYEALEDECCPDDFGVPQYGGKRTTKDQQDLYAIGRTVEMGRKPVTYVNGVEKKSNHQEKEDGYGHAFDVYIYDHKTKRASWNVDRLTRLAAHIISIAKSRGVILDWGGNWKWKDYPHFEYKGQI